MSIFINQKQPSMFGETPYVHRRKDGKPIEITLKGVIST